MSEVSLFAMRHMLKNHIIIMKRVTHSGTDPVNIQSNCFHQQMNLRPSVRGKRYSSDSQDLSKDGGVTDRSADAGTREFGQIDCET